MKIGRWRGALGAWILAASLGLGPSAQALTPRDLVTYGVAASSVTYRGRAAVKIEADRSPGAGIGTANGNAIALLKGSSFHNGVIDVWLAGAPKPGAPEAARGFVGVAFRVGSDPRHYEVIYIRPTNGRADDQLRRNHAIQYSSEPEYPWQRLRSESPGAYEAYADMAPGDWIRCRIVVTGAKARLFLGANRQPSLIVNDLKHGDETGGVALFIAAGTVAYFSGLSVKG
ncbi:hypothetical protein [Phenylobacterium sp.]|uniref:hypothetical protein n=1 Tax=Phenylobacterium sp. TaxID=1871053 RepID=UPI002F3F19E1